MEEHFAPADNDQARARLAAIVESSSDAIIGKTLDGIITSWNAAAEALYGYTAEEIVGKPVSMLVPPGARDDISIILNCIKRGKRVAHYRTERVAKDGRRIAVSLAVSPIKDAGGHPIGAATIARDISDAIRAEEAIRASERFTRLVLDALTIHLAILDEDGTIRYTNRAWTEFAAANDCAKQPDMIGTNYLHVCDCARGEGKPIARAAAAGIREVAEGRLPEFSLEYPCHSPTEQRWFHMRVTRFVDDGSVCIVVAHDDITERKHAEENLRRSEDKFAKAFLSTPEILVISDLKTGNYVEVNESFVDVIGFSRNEAIGKSSLELRIWADISQRAHLIDALSKGEPVRNWEIGLRKRTGEVFPALISADVVHIGGRRCLLAIVSDITERKMLEAERENARKALQGVYERERRIAETLQRNFLPDTSLKIDGYRTADAYLPALDEAAIGGDVYDIFRLPDGNIGLLVADVSGKGLKAGRYGAMVKYMLRAYAYRTGDPAEVLRKLNESVAIDMDIETFVTCFFAILDPGTGVFCYANAGHEEPLHLTRAGEAQRLGATGPALGFNSAAGYSSGLIRLAHGDIVFLYTDGVTDARGVDVAMEVDGLVEYLTSNCALSAESLVNCVLGEVRRRSGDVLRDDVAMLALEALD